MGRGRSGAGNGGAGGGSTSTAASNIGGGGGIIGNIPTNATPMTDADADKLRQLESSAYDANTTAAVKMYISNTDFDRQGHSLSQTMNFLEDNGVDLYNTDVNTINKQFGLRLTQQHLASMQYTSTVMENAAHPLGRDTTLQRGAHDDLLKNVFGISNYDSMSEQQLQKKLVGQGFRNTSHMSTSYDVNKNPFLGSSSGVSGGREVVYNIKAGANTKVLFGAKKQSEIVVSKGTNFRITGVRYTGKTAYPRGGGARKQLEIDIETF